jgi:AcrR family transcriptional regulator
LREAWHSREIELMGSISPPRSTAGASVARRHRILEAAMALFADLPYAEVHMDAIAAAARVAKPTLYRYVPTKEALFIEGLAWVLAQLRERLAAVCDDAEADHAARLRRAVAVVLEGVGPLSPALHAVEGHGSEFGERSRRALRRGFADLRDDLGRILAEGVAAGAFAPHDTDLAVTMILGTVRMAAHDPEGRAHAADALTTLFLDGLRAAPAVPAALAAPRLGEAA